MVDPGRARRPRRAVRPDTASTAQTAPDLSAQSRSAEPVSAADTDWSRAGGSPDAEATADRDEQWWREQRPPHWG